MKRTLSRNDISPGDRSCPPPDLRGVAILRIAICGFFVGLVLRDFAVGLRVVGVLRLVVCCVFFAGLVLRDFVLLAIAWGLSRGGLRVGVVSRFAARFQSLEGVARG